MKMETSKVGKRGAVVIPANIRRRYHIEEGSTVIVAERDKGILIRPAVTLPVEIYSAEREAEFLLSNAVDEASHEEAREEVRNLGLDPDSIPHQRPDQS